MRLCTYCGNPIPNQVRMDAQYCSSACRSKAYQRGLRLGFPEPKLTQEMIYLRDLLLSHAPPQATRYVLGLTELGRDIIWYPRVNSATGKIRRFDGSYSQSNSFSLRPFEAPRVPRATIYAVMFFDRYICQLETPHALSGGVHVPVATRMCLPGKTNAERKRRRPW